MKRITLLLLMAVLTIVLFYLSRFWFLDLWARGDFFGLRPDGGLLRRWLRGTQFAPFELLIWAVGVFMILTWLQRLVDFITSKFTQPGDEHDH